MRKAKKLLAFTLVLITLLTQTAAFAQSAIAPNFQPIQPLPPSGGGNITPIVPSKPVEPSSPSGGESSGNSSVHEHDYRWSTTKEATCTTPGQQRGTCQDCGYMTKRTIGKKKHDYEWTIIVEVTCKTDGERTGVCKTCGYEKTETVKKGQHNYTEWFTAVEPYGNQMGERKRVCQTCGMEQTEAIYPPDALYPGIEGHDEEVMQLQQALQDQNYLNSRVDGDYGKVTTAAVRAFQRDHGFREDGIAWEPVLSALFDKKMVHLQITDVVPPFAYCSSETTASVINEGYTVTGVSWLHGGSAMAADELFVQDEIYTVQVTLHADKPEGKEYTASINGEGASVVHEEDSTMIVVSCDMRASDGRGAGGEEIPDVIVTIETTVLNSPEVNPNFFVAGETIQFRTRVTRISNTFVSDVTVSSSLPGVEPGWKDWLTYGYWFDHSYTVTAEDAYAGKVVNQASATFVYYAEKDTSSDKYTGSVTAAPVEVPVGFDEGILDISQTLASAPVNGQYYVQGEQVAYQIVVENKGNLDLADVDVNGRMLGGTGSINSKIHTLDVLKKGEVYEFTYTHTVTNGDAAFGSITNEVSATAGDQYGFRYNAKSDSIKVPTNTPIYSVKVATDLVNHPKFHPDFFIEDETLQFETVVTNQSDMALLDVQMNSTIPGSSSATIARLEPGESVTFPYSYKVTEADALAGSILNQSGINFRYEDTGMMDSKSANDVTVPTILSDEIILDGGKVTIDTSTTTVVGKPGYSYVEVKPGGTFVTGTIVKIPDATDPPVVPVVTAAPVATTAHVVPESSENSEPVYTNRSERKPVQQPLWLTVEGTPVNGMVLRGEHTDSKALYQAQLAGEASCEMTLSAISDAKLGNQIIYIADLENSGVFSSIGTLFNFEADPAQTKVFFGPKNAQEPYQIAALMRMNASDEPFNLTNMTDLTNPAIYKVYQTALSMASVRLQNVEVAYGDEMLTLVVWDQAHNGQCLVVIARKQ